MGRRAHPYSIFFTKQGHAIHGTNHKIDGEAHSHGCVRLSVQHAAILWGLVKHRHFGGFPFW